MGVSTRKKDMLARWASEARNREAVADALATIEQFNARLAAGKRIWSWPIIGAALVTRHIWLVTACDACGTLNDLDLTMKRRDPEAPVRVALPDVRCARCNGHGRTRILRLAKFPSV